MIYQVDWSACTSFIVPTRPRYGTGPDLWATMRETYAGQKVDVLGRLAKDILEGKDDSHIFILMESQLLSFYAWIEKYGLEKYIKVQTPMVTNPVHPGEKRLTMFVLQAPEETNHESTT